MIVRRFVSRPAPASLAVVACALAAASCSRERPEGDASVVGMVWRAEQEE